MINVKLYTVQSAEKKKLMGIIAKMQNQLKSKSTLASIRKRTNLPNAQFAVSLLRNHMVADT